MHLGPLYQYDFLILVLFYKSLSLYTIYRAFLTFLVYDSRVNKTLWETLLILRGVKTFLYLLLRSWANGKNPQVMISFENVPMRSLANENSRLFPFFSSLPPLRISTSGLLAALPLSRAKISIMTRKSCDGQRHHLLSRLYFSFVLILPLIKKPSLSPDELFMLSRASQDNIVHCYAALNAIQHRRAGARLRRNKVALRNLRNNSWSTAVRPRALFLANVQIVRNLNSTSDGGFSEGVNCLCQRPVSRFTAGLHWALPLWILWASSHILIGFP